MLENDVIGLVSNKRATVEPTHTTPKSHLPYNSYNMSPTLTKVIFKPDSQSTDEFTVIVNPVEVCGYKYQLPSFTS